MRTIEVEDMFECPFKYDEHYQLSEWTSGCDTMCTILKDECYKENCPLIKENSIKIEWIGD